MKEVVDFIEKLEGGSFEEWSPDQVQGYMTACKSIKSFLSESKHKEEVDHIIKEMSSRFAFELTEEQVNEYLKEHPEAKFFDTEERSGYANYISEKVVGMSWPTYGHPKEYKEKFYQSMQDNAAKHGYVWNGWD